MPRKALEGAKKNVTGIALIIMFAAKSLQTTAPVLNNS